MTKENVTDSKTKIDQKELDQFRAEYESSPFWKYLGIQIDQLSPDLVRIKLPVNSGFLNVNESAHGGIALSLLDTIMGVTLRHQNINSTVATISMTTQFISPAFEGDTLYATARVVKAGRNIAFLEGSLESENGKVIATSIGNFLIKRKDLA